MYSALYLLWIFLNGRLTPEILLLGLLLVGIIGLFMRVVLHYGLKQELLCYRKLPLLFAYFFVLIWEIIKANASVIALILSPARKIRPTLVTFSPKLTTRFGQYLLANSITLTPGTITVKITDGEYTVHCLTPSLLDTSEQNVFIRLIRRLEASA